MGDPFIYEKITTDDVTFIRADEKSRKLAWQLNGVSWAAPIELEEYVRREEHLSQQALSRDYGCTYWILAHKDDQTHIVASCEATRKTAFIAGKGVNSRDAFVEATGYAIASVHTNPKYRRLGMAAYMLRQLQESMDADSECSALYSDIGKRYYANLGWDVFPSDQATIYLHADDKFTTTTLSSAEPSMGTRYLALDDLAPLCDRDVAALKAKFTQLAADQTKTHVAFAPDFAQISWQMAREDFMTETLHNKSVERRGAITASGDSWVYWIHDWREKTLKILRIVTDAAAEEEEEGSSTEEQRIWDIVELLRAAAAEAAAWGLKKVLLWNPDGTVTRGIKGFHNFHENEVDVIFDERPDTAIPSLRWQGGRSTADTVWEDNQYYAWC